MPLAMIEVRSCMERPFDDVLGSLKGELVCACACVSIRDVSICLPVCLPVCIPSFHLILFYSAFTIHFYFLFAF